MKNKIITTPDGAEYVERCGLIYLKEFPSSAQIEAAGGVFRIMDGAIGLTQNCLHKSYSRAIEKLIIPKSFKLDKFSFIDSDFKSVVFEEGVEVIGEYAFQDCTSLEHVVFPRSLKRIEACAFKRCHKLTSIFLNDGLEYIGSCAFKTHNVKNEIVVPASVTYVGYQAFTSKFKKLEFKGRPKNILGSFVLEPTDILLWRYSTTSVFHLPVFIDGEELFSPMSILYEDTCKIIDSIDEDDAFEFATVSQRNIETAILALKRKGKGKRFLRNNIRDAARQLLETKRGSELVLILDQVQLDKDEWKEIWALVNEKDFGADVRAAVLEKMEGAAGIDFSL